MSGHETNVKRDWDGRPVPDDESPDKCIKVWEIAPSLDTQYDSVVQRDPSKAIELAREQVENIIEGTGYEQEDAEAGCTVKIKLVEMQLGEYEGLFDEEG